MIPRSRWHYRALQAILRSEREAAEDAGDGEAMDRCDEEWDTMRMYKDKYEE